MGRTVSFVSRYEAAVELKFQRWFSVVLVWQQTHKPRVKRWVEVHRVETVAAVVCSERLQSKSKRKQLPQ